jgi:thiol-disulfide isomerase/thioredoxin
MRKLLLTFISCAAISVAFSQTFFDDFESYTAGAMLAATSSDWETWSSANGGADDVAVSSANAFSGSNSIYFSSTAATGGPTDLVMPFPGELEVGQFNLEMQLYVNTGAGAYFNLQEAALIGTAWAADIYFLSGGVAQFTSGGSLLLEANYPEGTWFNFRMENNLSTNTWEVFINDVSQGSYTNGSTQIASIDIFPLTGNQFYMDDFSYEFVDYTVPNFNGAVVGIQNMGSYLAGQFTYPGITVRNLGTTSITSFTLTLDYNGNTYQQDVTGVNIASLAFYNVAFASQVQLAAGLHIATATISNINGQSGDDDAEDDVKTLSLDPIVPAAGKAVVAEEATGTWCPWCVRGAVFMENLSNQYGNLYVGIAVHNADPMTVPAYDAAMGTLIGGYPSGVVDRGPEYDPSQFEIPFLERIQIAPKAFILNGANWDPTTRQLDISSTVTFQQSVSGNYRFAFVLTEDAVTGTGSSWNQANAYAGGGNGTMGGFESLPNPVPASQMIYDHVARLISPTFDGLSNAFTGAMNMNDVTTYNLSTILPADWDENEMHIIGMVIAPDGTIDNAYSCSIAEAHENEYQQGTAIVGMTELSSPVSAPSIYPNPANNSCFIDLDLKQNTELAIEIYNAEGKLMQTKKYGTYSGMQHLTINTSEWAAGVYKARIITNGVANSYTLVKE